MLSLSVDLADVAQLEQAPRMLARDALRLTEAIAARAVPPLKQNAPKATSNMANSIRHIATQTGAEILFPANYTGFAHEGRMPGDVDTKALVDWAKVKGLGERAGFAIARSIRAKGTKGHPWASDYLESSDFSDLVRREIARAVA